MRLSFCLFSINRIFWDVASDNVIRACKSLLILLHDQSKWNLNYSFVSLIWMSNNILVATVRQIIKWLYPSPGKSCCSSTRPSPKLFMRLSIAKIALNLINVLNFQSRFPHLIPFCLVRDWPWNCGRYSLQREPNRASSSNSQKYAKYWVF